MNLKKNKSHIKERKEKSIYGYIIIYSRNLSEI